jgi:hypothetical protein
LSYENTTSSAESGPVVERRDELTGAPGLHADSSRETARSTIFGTTPIELALSAPRSMSAAPKSSEQAN